MTQPVDPQHPNDPVLSDYLKEQRIEYGTYIATEDIRPDGVTLMATRGSAVLKSTAERLGWDKDGDHGPAKVVKRDSAAGRKLLGELGLLPAEEMDKPQAKRAATTGGNA